MLKGHFELSDHVHSKDCAELDESLPTPSAEPKFIISWITLRKIFRKIMLMLVVPWSITMIL